MFRLENTRASSGEESVYLCHMVYRKNILLCSKNKIAKDFKKENPGREFSFSVIKQEFPLNILTATTRDSERNTCQGSEGNQLGSWKEWIATITLFVPGTW